MQGGLIAPHRLVRCVGCGIVTAECREVESVDYSDYGSYLEVSDSEIARRITFASSLNRSRLQFLKRWFGHKARLLDFGGGAGYFGKAAEQHGFETWVVEPSVRLRQFATERVGFTRIVESLDVAPGDFDAIFLFDVIEHFDPKIINSLMKSLLDRLNRGGYLMGNTPNFSSANIRISNQRDPVIAPPHHLCYFTPKTLDHYLVGLGLTRNSLRTKGLSTNSFFRPDKRTQSFLEKPFGSLTVGERATSIAIRASFKGINLLISPLDLGYQIYFDFSK